MEQSIEIPVCPLPSEIISDMVPMGVVLGLFLLGGWLFRRWQKKWRDEKRRH